MAAKLNLDKALSKHAYDHAVICTYTFDAHYFENYALEQLIAFSGNANISVLVDQGTYDKLLGGGPLERPKRANIRYLFHPIRAVKTFHPKLVLLATKAKGLLLVGSANFTRVGLTQNAELVSQFSFEAGTDERHLSLFREAFAFVEVLGKRFPSEALASNLRDLVADAPWLLPSAQGSTERHPARLLHNLDVPLWDQLAKDLQRPIQRLEVLSPFFDEQPHLLTEVLSRSRPESVLIRTQNRTTTMTPAWLEHPAVQSGTAQVLLCEFAEEGKGRDLHAKGLAISHPGGVRLAYGSANFTRAALLETASKGNVELVVAIDGEFRTLRPASLFDPFQTGVLLSDPSTLQSTPRTKRPAQPVLEVRLALAEVHERTIRCLIEFPQGGAMPTSLTGLLDLPGFAEVSLPLKRTLDHWTAELLPQVATQLDQESAVLRVRADWGGNRSAISNAVLVLNLLELHTGTSLKRERRIREAQLNAEQFARILNELIQSGNDDDLIRFLTLCDIYLPAVLVGPVRTGGRPAWDAPDGMRELGARNLVLFGTLHEATRYFVERHLRRLARHLETPSLEHASIFMHVVLAVGDVLRKQLERGVLGLELAVEPITSDDWFEWRSRFDWYSTQFEQVYDLVTSEYLHRLSSSASQEETRLALTPDLGPLIELAKRFGELSARSHRSLGKTAWVQLPTGQKVVPLVRSDNLLHPPKWADLVGKVQTHVRLLNAWLAA